MCSLTDIIMIWFQNDSEQSAYQMFDIKPHLSCCGDDMFSTEYCPLYLEKRPASTGYNYNMPVLGKVH